MQTVIKLTEALRHRESYGFSRFTVRPRARFSGRPAAVLILSTADVARCHSPDHAWRNGAMSAHSKACISFGRKRLSTPGGRRHFSTALAGYHSFDTVPSATRHGFSYIGFAEDEFRDACYIVSGRLILSSGHLCAGRGTSSITRLNVVC